MPLKAEVELVAAENAKLRAEIAGIKSAPQMIYKSVWVPDTRYRWVMSSPGTGRRG